MRKDVLYFSLLFLSVALVFWDLIFLQRAFLSGDHLIQHYPWASFLQNQIRQFRLPWWTSQIQSGFPLLAEGQIGAFYLPNLVFLFLLPLKWAYNYEILFHYALAALFFYGYIRALKLSPEAALFSSLIFLFGSTNGGYFYNLTSQRVTVWFPLALLLVEKLFEKKLFRAAAGLGIVFALQVFAGYLQIAIYTVGFTTIYFLLRLFQQHEKGDSFRLPLLAYALAAVWGIAISAVQWVPTFQLAFYSSRAAAVKELAYEGSASPLSLMTLLFPDWTGFWRGGFYVGVLGFFFALVSLLRKKTFIEKAWWILFVISLLLAWGKYSPLYLALVNLVKIYYFRVPAKFLFFSAFALTVLAAYGFDEALKGGKERAPVKRAWGICVAFFLIVFLGLMVGHAVAKNFQKPISASLETYVREHIYGKPFHPHSIDVYREKIKNYVHIFLSFSSLKAQEMWVPILLFAFQMGVAARFLLKSEPKRWALLWAALLALDLFYYTTQDIRTDLYPYRLVDSSSKLIETIRNDRSLFRVHVFNTDLLTSGILPYVPNQNMIWGFSDTGIYSPLAFREYKAFLGNLGGVDDSLYALPPHVDFLKKNKEILDHLNVKYILANRALEIKGLDPVGEEGPVRLYRNDSFLPRFFFVKSIEAPLTFKESKEVEVLDFGEGFYRLKPKSKEAGYLVVSEQNYPGWSARLLGKKVAPIALAPCLKAFPLPANTDTLLVSYEEKDKGRLYAVSGASFFLACFVLGQGLPEFLRRNK